MDEFDKPSPNFDERWEKVWAEVRNLGEWPPPEDTEIAGYFENWFDVRIEVIYDGQYCYAAQRIHKQDFEELMKKEGFYKFLWDELVMKLDEHLEHPDG